MSNKQSKNPAVEHNYELRPLKVKAVQFTGKNSIEVAKWINRYCAPDNKAVARGSYVSFEKFQGCKPIIIVAGDYAVTTFRFIDGVSIYDAEQFEEEFQKV